MSGSNILTGRVWKFGDNISTDLIMPSFGAMSSPNMDPHEAALFCMRANRPDCAEKVRPGDIVIAGKNFGCGSSREHAPVVLKVKGIKCIVADSFARIFYRNAINIGLPVLEIGKDVEKIQPGDTIDVDMAKGEITIVNKNIVIKTKPLPEFIQKIAD